MEENERVKCPKCGCEILKEHLNLDCHAHNDTNLWRREGKGDMYEVFRTRVVKGEADVNA